MLGNEPVVPCIKKGIPAMYNQADVTMNIRDKRICNSNGETCGQYQETGTCKKKENTRNGDKFVKNRSIGKRKYSNLCHNLNVWKKRATTFQKKGKQQEQSQP